MLEDGFRTLNEPDSRRSSQFVFYIGRRRLLNSGIVQLIPEHILNGVPFDPSRANEDDFSVCFADGNVDQLARFLPGMAFKWLETDLQETNSIENARKVASLLTSRYAIAVARKQKCFNDGPHDIWSLYTDQSAVDDVISVYRTNEPIPIEQTIEIARLQFTDDQKRAILSQGQEFYRTVISQNPAWWPRKHNEPRTINSRSVTLVYALCRMQELAVKAALIRVPGLFE